MSAQHGFIRIVCDGPPAADCADSAAWVDRGPAYVLRQRLEENGWNTGLLGGLDLCPACGTVTTRQGFQR